jgi:hypothetical protein
VLGVGPNEIQGDLVLDEAVAGRPYPKTAGPAPNCLLSIDYGRGDSGVVAIEGATLATFYANWGADATPSLAGYSPKDGLGLIRSDGISAVATRSTKDPKFEYLEFTRGVLYAPQIVAHSNLTSVTAGGVSAAIDPTRFKVPASTYTTQPAVVPTPGGAASPSIGTLFPPTPWRVLPSGLHRALLADQDALKAAILPNGTPAGLSTGIEVPPLLRIDDRYYAIPVDPLPGFLQAPPRVHSVYGTDGAEFWTPLAYQGRESDRDRWVVIPSAIAKLAQHRSYLGLDARPSEPASYRQTVALQPLLLVQRFRVRDAFETPGPMRSIETQWPRAFAPAAVSESSVSFGTRWTTNAGRADCWYHPTDVINAANIASRPYPFASGAIDDQAALDWCPARLYDWWRSHPSANTTENSRDDACGASNVALDDLASYVTKAAEKPQTIGCIGASSIETFICEQGVIVSLLLGAPAPELATCAIAALSPEDRDKSVKCIAEGFQRYYRTKLPNDIHWVDLDSPVQLMPMVGFLNGFDGLRSSIANGDAYWNHAHQASDWNWTVETPKAVDPDYESLVDRWHWDHDAAGRWVEHFGQDGPVEHELEFLVAEGRWQEAGHADDEINTRENRWSDFIGDANMDWLGEVFPNDYCPAFGIDRADKPDKVTNPTYPSQTCGGKNYEAAYWRTHFGRGMFFPFLSGLDTDPATPQDQMSKTAGWPTASTDAAPATLPLGVEDWGARPHRLGFLGRPIIDCGHPNARWHIELHPPHLLTMDLAHASDPSTGAKGVVLAAFGWVNIAIPGRLEFDLWPPPRSSAQDELVVLGATTLLAEPAGGPGFPPEYGYVIDNTGPQHGATSPTLTCIPAPKQFPNRLHCVYTDPAGGPRPPTVDDPMMGSGSLEHDETRNTRMEPFYATSRFDLRVFLGWKRQ